MSDATGQRDWVLRPFVGVGPVVFGAPRGEVRETLPASHRFMSRPSHTRVAWDEFVTPGESIVTVTYDQDDRVLAAWVAVRQVTLPDGFPLLGRTTTEVMRHLEEGRYRVRDESPTLEVPDMGLQLWVAWASRSVSSVRAVRRNYLAILASIGEEEPSGAPAVRTTIRCSVCGAPAATVELVPPGRLPAEWETWPDWRRASFWSRPRGSWWFIYAGPDSGNGLGRAVTPDRGRLLADSFSEPVSYDRVHRAGFYDEAGFCRQCERPYCSNHWGMTATGFGWCPMDHRQSLDPHWTPAD